MLGPGMQLAQKNAAVAWGDACALFNRNAHTRELLRRHDQEKLVLGVGEQNKLLGLTAAPAGRDGDAVFLIDGVLKFAGVKDRNGSGGLHGPGRIESTSIHFAPLLTTTACCGQYIFTASFLPARNRLVSSSPCPDCPAF